MLTRRLAAEALATALLSATVVGSGIMGQRLAGGNVAIVLLVNTISTGAVLVAIILAFGPISGAHLNPVVTITDAIRGGLSWGDAPFYIGAQLVGGIVGVGIANLMFGLPVFAWSIQARSGAPQLFSEMTATFGLLAVIWGCNRKRPDLVPIAVGAYITAAYLFTASTSFANPALTVARSMTNTFAGIRPGDVPSFILAQAGGTVAAVLLFRWMDPGLSGSRLDVVGSDKTDVV